MSRNKMCVAQLLGMAAGVLAIAGSAPAQERTERRVTSDQRLFADAGDRDPGARENPRERDPGARRPEEANREAPDSPEARRDARRRQAGGNDWFRDRAYYAPPAAPERAIGAFPSNEVHDVVIANARAATARAVYRRAETALNTAVRRAKQQFEESDEFRKALAEEQEAYTAYKAARTAALSAVASDPKYQAILSLHAGLADQISARRRQLDSEGYSGSYLAALDTPAGADLLALASLRMNIGNDARVMEQIALEDSEELRSARDRLRTAGDRVADLRRKFDREVRENEDLIAAREILEDARIARLTAAAYLKGAMLAADEALDFAYYLHRYDGRVVFDPYNIYGNDRYDYVIGY